MKRNRHTSRPSISKYVLISFLVFALALIMSSVTRMLLTNDTSIRAKTGEQASLVASMIEGAVGAVAAGFVLYQLRIGEAVNKRQNDIEEAEFLLQYNQAFIQDQNMCSVEQKLEQWMNGDMHNEPLINDENRQLFINYLVHLEGLAPLIFRGILKLEHIDDLMAYRFFLAVNNSDLQKDQLFAYADYYRGCLKLYNHWRDYRHSRNYPILLYENSLDKWTSFELYTDCDVEIKSLSESDNLKSIAGLIYDTDPYIYPAAFGSRRAAQVVIPELIRKDSGLFSHKNIRIAKVQEKTVGVVVYVRTSDDSEVISDRIKQFPKTFSDVNKRYFNSISTAMKRNEAAYIACISVDSHFRNRRIGEMLLIRVLHETHGSRIMLDVLTDNADAIALYNKYGFAVSDAQKCGYAYNCDGPACYTMLRNPSGKMEADIRQLTTARQ